MDQPQWFKCWLQESSGHPSIQLCSRKFLRPYEDVVEPTANGARGIVPSYGLLDLNFSFRFADHFILRAGVNNLFDKQYFTKRPLFYPGPGVWSSDGRSVVVSLGVKFDFLPNPLCFDLLSLILVLQAQQPGDFKLSTSNFNLGIGYWLLIQSNICLRATPSHFTLAIRYSLLAIDLNFELSPDITPCSLPLPLANADALRYIYLLMRTVFECIDNHLRQPCPSGQEFKARSSWA